MGRIYYSMISAMKQVYKYSLKRIEVRDKSYTQSTFDIIAENPKSVRTKTKLIALIISI